MYISQLCRLKKVIKKVEEFMVEEIDRDVPCALLEDEVDQVRGFFGTVVSVEGADNTR